MSRKPIFGDKESAQTAARFMRGNFSDTLDVIALKERGRAAIEADEAAWAAMLPAQAAESVPVTRQRRVRRARVNTIAPSKTTDPLRVIYSGLDAFVVNVKGAVNNDVMLLLPMAQDEAKEVDGLALSPLPPFLGEDVMIRQHGGGTFRFLLGNGDIVVKVRKADHAANMDDAQVEVTAACLHRVGWRAAVIEVRDWVRLWATHAVLQVSEIDLCADTQGWCPTGVDFFGDGKAFVCPVGRPHLIPYDGEHVGYVRFGTGGAAGSRSGQAPIQCVIYDKTEEIREHDKGWFVPLWAASSLYDADEMVTRVEFRFRREWLKEHRLDTVDDVLDRLGAMWAEGLEWCRYCVSRPQRYNDAGEPIPVHRERWDVRREWGLLASVSWGDAEVAPLTRLDQVRPRLERTLAAWAGYTVTLQALFGPILPIDMAELATLAVGAAGKRWDARGETYDLKVKERYKRFAGMQAG
jgi:hypothetical protein